MLSVLREMPEVLREMPEVEREPLEVEREPPEVEVATLSVLREQLSVFGGTPRSLGGLRRMWREPLPELRARPSAVPEKSAAIHAVAQ
jgi:hypothetical protein